MLGGLKRHGTAAVSIAVALVSCTMSRSAPPQGKRAEIPRFEFPGLKGRAIRVEVLDHRANRENGAAWVARLTQDITGALTGAGVSVTKDAAATLEVRITRLRSDFESANWTACANLTTNFDLRSEGGGRTEFSVDPCVTHANTWGTTTADRALQQVYQDALVEFLSVLDSRARETSPKP